MTHLHKFPTSNPYQTEAPTTIASEDKGLIELRLCDKSYFAKNPTHGSYRREPANAERTKYPDCQFVDVLAVSPGAEARIKFYRPGDQVEADGDSKMARAWSRAILERQFGVKQ